MDDGDDMSPIIPLGQDNLVSTIHDHWSSRSRGPALLEESASWSWRGQLSSHDYGAQHKWSTSWELFIIMSERTDFR